MDEFSNCPITLNDLLTLALGGNDFNRGHRNLLDNFLRILMNILDVRPECVHIDTLNDVSKLQNALDGSADDIPEPEYVKEIRFFRSPDDFEEKKSYITSHIQIANDTAMLKKIDYLQCELTQLKQQIDRFTLEFRRRLPNRTDCDYRNGWSDEKCNNEKLSLENYQKISEKKSQDVDRDYVKYQMHKAVNDAAKIMKNVDLCPTFDLPKTCKQTCSPVNYIACQLLTDKDFLSEIMKRVSCPIIDKIFNFEEQIAHLNDCFLKFMKTAEKEISNKPTTEKCMEEIIELKRKLEEKDRELLQAFEEVQEILDTKFDKFHVPPLKKFISDNINLLTDKIKTLKEHIESQKAVATIVKGVKCLSCNSDDVCQIANVDIISKLPSLKLSTKKREPLPKCSNIPTSRKCGGRHTLTQPFEKILRRINLVDQFGQGVVYEPKVAYTQGTDGTIYRTEPKPTVCPCPNILNKRLLNPCGSKNIQKDLIKGELCNVYKTIKQG